MQATTHEFCHFWKNVQGVFKWSLCAAFDPNKCLWCFRTIVVEAGSLTISLLVFAVFVSRIPMEEVGAWAHDSFCSLKFLEGIFGVP